MVIKKIYLIVGALSIVGFLVSSFYQIFYKKQNSFNEANTTLKITGPASLEVGEAADIEVSYKNNNRINLKGAVLTLSYPEKGFGDIQDNSGFGQKKSAMVIWDLGDISAGYEGAVKISVRVTDISANKLRAELEYEPENFSSFFSSQAEHSFSVKAAEVSLNLFAPKEIVSGQEVKYILTYTNASFVDFGLVRFKFNYPAGFVFKNSTPAGTEGNNVWEIKDLTRSSSGQIEVAGILSGTAGDSKSLNVSVEEKINEDQFVLNSETSAETVMQSSPFAVIETVNDRENYSAGAGETLNYKVKLRNLSSEPENNIIISVLMDGEAADYVYLEAPGATVNKEAHTIIWDKNGEKGIISLKPQEEMEQFFSVKVNSKLPIIDSATKNFIIKNTVVVKDGNVFNAEGENKVLVISAFENKINSTAALFTRGYFNDDGRIKTSGPIPPKVGQTTVYNIKWQILNTSNRIKNVKVIGVLPADVSWTGDIFPVDGKIFYDVNTRVVTWEAGDIEPATGILSPLKEIVFQLSITPKIEDLDRYMILIDQNNLTATDDFTLSEIAVKSDGITTRLPDDVSIGEEQGRVVN